MKASLMRPIPPGSTRSMSTGSSAAYTDDAAPLPVEITEKRIELSDDSNDYVTRWHTQTDSYVIVQYTRTRLSVRIVCGRQSNLT